MYSYTFGWICSYVDLQYTRLYLKNQRSQAKLQNYEKVLMENTYYFNRLVNTKTYVSSHGNSSKTSSLSYWKHRSAKHMKHLTISVIAFARFNHELALRNLWIIIRFHFVSKALCHIKERYFIRNEYILPTHSLSSMVLLKPTSHFPKHWKLPGKLTQWRLPHRVLFSAHSSTSSRKKKPIKISLLSHECRTKTTLKSQSRLQPIPV